MLWECSAYSACQENFRKELKIINLHNKIHIMDHEIELFRDMLNDFFAKCWNCSEPPLSNTADAYVGNEAILDDFMLGKFAQSRNKGKLREGQVNDSDVPCRDKVCSSTHNIMGVWSMAVYLFIIMETEKRKKMCV